MNTFSPIKGGMDAGAFSGAEDALLLNNVFDYPAIEEMDPSLGEQLRMPVNLCACCLGVTAA